MIIELRIQQLEVCLSFPPFFIFIITFSFQFPTPLPSPLFLSSPFLIPLFPLVSSKSLLSIEENAKLCDKTSQDYHAYFEKPCVSFLLPSFVFMVSSILLIIFLFILSLCGSWTSPFTERPLARERRRERFFFYYMQLL